MVSRIAGFVLVAFAIFIAGFVAGQPNERAHTTNTKAQAESPQRPTSNSVNDRTEKTTAPNDDSPKWYAALKRPEWWLVLVAFLTLAVIAWQAWETRRAVEIGRDSASATNKNLELFISKERARLKIGMRPLDLAADKTNHTVDFTVTSYGATPAFIVEAKCGAGEWPLHAIDDPYLMDMAMTNIYAYPSFPTSISPNAKPIESYSFLFLDDARDLMLPEVKADRLFVVVRGFIKYRDVFDRERETRFRYVWKYSWLSAKDSPDRYGTWEKCGPEDQNSEI